MRACQTNSGWRPHYTFIPLNSESAFLQSGLSEFMSRQRSFLPLPFKSPALLSLLNTQADMSSSASPVSNDR